MNSKTVILLGAGSVVPWGAPSTYDITNQIKSDITFKSYTGKPIGLWLYDKLSSHYYKDIESITFETIINSLEYLTTFFASKYRESIHRYKNQMPAFFEEKDDLWELLLFDRIYKKKSNGWWESINEQHNSYSFWNDYDLFFESVFRHFTNRIVSIVKNYSTPDKKHIQLNSLCTAFLNSFTIPIRCYTTNYDRIIPQFNPDIFFEGFTSIDGKNKFDLERVLRDEHYVYYNLHGSVHYELDFPNDVTFCPDNFVYNFGSSASDKSDQDKRKIINSNIITGFNKPSRIMSNPYLQFYHRFFQDCLSSSIVYVVGYSFNDIHINNAIKSASLVNPSLKIICITWNVVADETLDNDTYDWVRLNSVFLMDEFSDNIYYTIADSKNVDNIYIYRKGFQKFLECQQWTDIEYKLSNLQF